MCFYINRVGFTYNRNGPVIDLKRPYVSQSHKENHMLRKCSSFFDPSIGSLDDGISAYEKARRIRDGLSNLVEDIAVARIFDNDGADDRVRALKNRLETCLEEGVCGEDLVREFDAACQKTHRIEFLFSYPWEDEPAEGGVRRREMYLDVCFFEKNKRQPFYKITLWISSATGIVYDEHWGAWPDDDESRRLGGAPV